MPRLRAMAPVRSGRLRFRSSAAAVVLVRMGRVELLGAAKREGRGGWMDLMVRHCGCCRWNGRGCLVVKLLLVLLLLLLLLELRKLGRRMAGNPTAVVVLVPAGAAAAASH